MGECKTLLVAWKWVDKGICNVISSRVRWMYMLSVNTSLRRGSQYAGSDFL